MAGNHILTTALWGRSGLVWFHAQHERGRTVVLKLSGHAKPDSSLTSDGTVSKYLPTLASSLGRA